MIIVIISERIWRLTNQRCSSLAVECPNPEELTHRPVKVTLLSLRPGQELDNSFTDKCILFVSRGQVYFPPVRTVCRNCDCCSLLWQVFTATFCSGPPMSHLKIVLMLPTFGNQTWSKGHNDIVVFKASHVIYTTREWKKNAHANEKKNQKTTERHTRKDKERSQAYLNSNFIMQLMVSTYSSSDHHIICIEIKKWTTRNTWTPHPHPNMHML